MRKSRWTSAAIATVAAVGVALALGGKDDMRRFWRMRRMLRIPVPGTRAVPMAPCRVVARARPRLAAG